MHANIAILTANRMNIIAPSYIQPVIEEFIESEEKHN